MTKAAAFIFLLQMTLGISCALPQTTAPSRLAELDAFWREASRTVREGDFAGYKATYHEDAVLVSLKDSVQFKFAKRVGDDTTAHESGIFLYSETDAAGKTKDSYVHFDALLVKRGGWKMVMEYQKNEATKAEWDALPAP